MTFAVGKRALAVCDRCGFDCAYSDLKEESIRGIRVNNAVCPRCWDLDHPQNWAGSDRVFDNEALRDPNPENFDGLRTLFGFAPVGAPSNQLMLMSGSVSVRI